jgi:hypothetical protein
VARPKSQPPPLGLTAPPSGSLSTCVHAGRGIMNHEDGVEIRLRGAAPPSSVIRLDDDRILIGQ